MKFIASIVILLSVSFLMPSLKQVFEKEKIELIKGNFCDDDVQKELKEIDCFYEKEIMNSFSFLFKNNKKSKIDLEYQFNYKNTEEEIHSPPPEIV